MGKSFFMAQLAYHVSTGQKLWDFEVHQGTVLYLALEDDYRRLQERMYRMFGVEGTDHLHFAVYAKQLGDGLDEQLDRFVTEHPDTNLVIIDTLQKIREVGGEAYSYADDYKNIGRLKRFCKGVPCRGLSADSWGSAPPESLAAGCAGLFGYLPRRAHGTLQPPAESVIVGYTL